LDEIDHGLFEATPMIFVALIDQKPDSVNHVSHLVVTKSERDKLLNAITTVFGEKLNQNNQDYIIGSSVIKACLLKGYKSNTSWGSEVQFSAIPQAAGFCPGRQARPGASGRRGGGGRAG
jgi:hypothetical protein